MNRTVAGLLAALAAGATAGNLAPRILSTGTATQPAVVLEWQNAQLFDTRSPLRDGGGVVYYRACGYLNEVRKDGGVRRAAEPCWDGHLTKGEANALAARMLLDYKEPGQ